MSGCFHLSCHWPVVLVFEFEAEAESHFMNDEVRRFLQVGKLPRVMQSDPGMETSTIAPNRANSNQQAKQQD